MSRNRARAGVEVFFVLAGFLITSLLVAEWERSSVHRSAYCAGLLEPRVLGEIRKTIGGSR